MNGLYSALQAQTSVMKLSAPRLRASGSEGPIDAAILLHDVERAEARALKALGPLVDDMTRFRSAIERCGLLVEARDPSTVLHERWPEVWKCAEAFPSEVVGPALRRLEPAVEALRVEQQAMIARHRTLRMVPRSALATGGGELRKALAALKQYLMAFPGDWNAWQYLALMADAQELPAEAWRAIQIARRLEPDDDAGWSVEVNLATASMSPDELRRWLDQTATVHYRGRGDADVALALAGGYALLARQSLTGGRSAELQELLAKAQAAVTHSYASLTSRTEPEVRRYVRAMQLVINELRAGHEPKASILDRAGLPELHAFLDRNDHDTLATLRRSPAEVRGLAA